MLFYVNKYPLSTLMNMIHKELTANVWYLIQYHFKLEVAKKNRT